MLFSFTVLHGCIVRPTNLLVITNITLLFVAISYRILVGLLGGYLLHRFLLGMIGSDAIMFNPRVTIDVYLIPIVTILMILSILGYYVNNSLKEVDMLESLKSVD